VMWIVLSLLFFAAGEAASKLWAANPRWWLFAAAISAYVACEIPWLVALRTRNHLTSLGTAWSVGAVLATILLGALVFGETISAKQYVGIVFAFAAFWMLC